VKNNGMGFQFAIGSNRTVSIKKTDMGTSASARYSNGWSVGMVTGFWANKAISDEHERPGTPLCDLLAQR